MPPKWQKIFQKAGIKKKQLKNPEEAAFIMKVLTTVSNEKDNQKIKPEQVMETVMEPPPLPPRDDEIEQEQEQYNSAPLPKPPVVAPSKNSSPPPKPPVIAPSNNNSAPKPQMSSLMSSSSFIEQLQSKKEKLNHVQEENLEKMVQEQEGTLISILQLAMEARRDSLENDEESSSDSDEWN
eukprot:CAMPEP_0174262076 /NCGR_PEP_ID=MMETSP0439-20130205/12757_1 /TAXON_ID=0 /ORGANISM="Stereomyxa ramosa, Strain Chinc5" /LENGTH=180 /DNA_ID=CAMNT_0015346715 /DNA_START=366 /DNA_END=908 /DNA_ORIENTATION=+